MTRPGKIVCVGRNYREHAKELGNDVPSAPLLFLKPSTAVIAPGAAIVMPQVSQRVDFEGEIGVVVGTTLRKASPVQCVAGIRGVVALNDVTARDLQKSDVQFTRAKGFDTFCPIGPLWEGVPPLDAITVVTRVNGTEKQRASSAEMVFPIADLLSYISHVMTLEPGDVVATGTPSGVAPLQAGDVVEVELVGYSVVRNPVEAEA
ncbi:MAG: fumarylacetoacetate hydrolase family protein [Gemmatimonadaceae bacterium]|nr:fumarylacetoacetate hydrolase family protein [Gemmatimonadaceae bacterium]